MNKKLMVIESCEDCFYFRVAYVPGNTELHICKFVGFLNKNELISEDCPLPDWNEEKQDD